MAKQGISTSLGSVLIHGYTAAGVFYEPYLTETYDEATNTSTLSIAHRIRIMEEWGGRYDIPDSTPIYVTIDGTTTTHTFSSMPSVYPNNTPVTVQTTTHTVTHNSDGAKTITISCRWNNSSASYQGATSSKTVTLTTIPRASTMTFNTSQTMGTAYTFTISRASSSFTHTITWSFGGTSGTAVSKTSSTKPSFTPAVATFAPLCTNAESATIVYTLNTYSGSTLIGSKSYSGKEAATLAVPSSVAPSVSLAVSAVNPFNSLYLQGKSSVKLTATGSVSDDHGATIRSYSFQVLNSASTAVSSGSSSTSSTSATHTSGVLTGSGKHTCKVTITDSRGRTATATRTIKVTAYSKPVWGTTSAYRCDSAGDVAEEGTYIALTAMAQYSAVSGNSISLTYQTKESTASSWSSATSYTNGQKTIIGSAYDITKAYNVKVTATDTVGNTITTTLYVSTSAVGIDYDPTNNTLGLLRYAPTGSSDSVYMPNGYAYGADGSTFRKLLTEDKSIPLTCLNMPSVKETVTSCFVTFTENFTIENITVPKWSKGIISTTSTDASLIAVAPSGNIYHAYRNGSTWRDCKCDASTALFSGTLSSSSGNVKLAYGKKYDRLIVVAQIGLNADNVYLTSITVPVAVLTTAAARWIISDESRYTAFYLWLSGNDGYIAAAARSTDACYVKYVYGVS